jgi:cytochrome P450
MISMDPPRHDRLKKIVGRAFTPKRIAEHEDHIRRSSIASSIASRIGTNATWSRTSHARSPPG